MKVKTFGPVDARSLRQLETCMQAGGAELGVLCADHHPGYSQPIGGGVAYEDHISPSGVGYDIGCGNKAVQTDLTRADLLRLAEPRPLSAFRIAQPPPAGVLLRYYREAERRFGVAWNVLAAVNFVESAFGKLRSSSTAGAQGPMQFLPSTWRRYGLGGDVHDPHDAILGAANYLHAAGAPGRYQRALYAYNPSQAYVDGVLHYAHRMRVDPRAFLEYYAWQVFVRTPRGLRRLTGPGL